MMEVWILLVGEVANGDSVRGVYASRKDAEAAAANVQPCLTPWVESERDGCRTTWRSGCDVMTVERWKVEAG